jgi:hypothetical protein
VKIYKRRSGRGYVTQKFWDIKEAQEAARTLRHDYIIFEGNNGMHHKYRLFWFFVMKDAKIDKVDRQYPWRIEHVAHRLSKETFFGYTEEDILRKCEQIWKTAWADKRY